MRYRERVVLKTHTLEAGWYLPSNEEFGRFGWFFKTLSGAEAKREELLKNKGEKDENSIIS